MPAQQLAIASKTGKLIAEHFFSPGEIEEKISDPSNFQKIMPAIEEHIDDFLRNNLKKQMPFIGLLISDKTIGTLKGVFLEELEDLFPGIMRSYAANFIDDLNIEQLVTHKIAAVSLSDIENAFRWNFSKELRPMELASWVAGLFIGFVFLLLVYFISK